MDERLKSGVWLWHSLVCSARRTMSFREGYDVYYHGLKQAYCRNRSKMVWNCIKISLWDLCPLENKIQFLYVNSTSICYPRPVSLFGFVPIFIWGIVFIHPKPWKSLWTWYLHRSAFQVFYGQQIDPRSGQWWNSFIDRGWGEQLRPHAPWRPGLWELWRGK